MNKPIPNVLTIAGSDSGGGAGIQADIKAISATGSYACSAITALTAQNTQGVSAILPIDPAFVAAQLDAIFSDIEISAVKIGMLHDVQIIELVAQKLIQYRPPHIVLDPVMVATSGDALINQEAIATLKQSLLPIVEIITPNLPEAVILAGTDTPASGSERTEFISRLQGLNTANILLKGGHFDDLTSDDWLINTANVFTFSAQRVATNNTHGTGCSLSSAIASYLAQGFPLPQAVQRAKDYLTQALIYAERLMVGKGHGPVDHFYKQHKD